MFLHVGAVLGFTVVVGLGDGAVGIAWRLIEQRENVILLRPVWRRTAACGTSLQSLVKWIFEPSQSQRDSRRVFHPITLIYIIQLTH